jgi:hypothetical protein
MTGIQGVTNPTMNHALAVSGAANRSEEAKESPGQEAAERGSESGKGMNVDRLA